MCVIPSPLFADERLQSVLTEMEEKLENILLKVHMKAKEPADIEQQDWVMIPCINSSRIGSDVAVALGCSGLIGMCIKAKSNDQDHGVLIKGITFVKFLSCKVFFSENIMIY